MALTVPTSRVAPGRSADVRVSQAIPNADRSPGMAPDAGSSISRLGDALLQIGTGLEDDRLSREAQRLDIDMTRDLFKLRQELELSNDPDAVDREWAPRLAALKEQYLTGVADNGVPRVDRKNRQRFDLAFTSLADRHAMELGARAIQLRQAVDVAQGAEMRNELVVQGAVVGDEVLPELIARGEAWIDGQAAKYGTDAATVQTQKAEFRASIYSQRADTLIANDPQGFLTAAEAGTFNSLGEDLTAKKLAAQAQLDKLAALGIKESEAAEREAAAIRDDRVKAIGAIWTQGRTPADTAYLDTPEAQQSPHWGKAMAARALQDELPALKQMTPEELDAAIEAEEARPITEEWENERLTVLRGWRDQAAAGWNTAPVETARAAGMNVPEVRAFDPAAPQQFVDDLAQAVRFQDAVQQGGYTTAPAVFDKATQSQLTAVLAPAADPEAKQALLSAIVVGAGPQAQAVLDQLGAAPELRRTARYLATSPAAYGQLAKDALAGQQKIALKTAVLPSERVAVQMFDAATGGALAGMGEVQRRETLDLAFALYANEAQGVDPDQADAGLTAWVSDPKRVELFNRAAIRASGALEGGTGGVQEIEVAKGQTFKAALPLTVSATQAQFALSAVNLGLRGDLLDERSGNINSGFGRPAEAAREAALTALKRASVDDRGRPNGALPDLGPDPADYFAGLRILRIGETDVYHLVDMSSGRPMIVGDAEGKKYRFRLPDLVRHTKGGLK
jgi:hypothetical protein